MSYLPLLAIAVSLIGTIFIVYTRKNKNLREAVTIVTAVAKLLIVAVIVNQVWHGNVPEIKLYDLGPGLSIAFKADAFGAFFALTAAFLWLLTSIYSIGYMRGHAEHSQTRYFAAFSVAMSAAMGIAFSANLLTLFIFYEILTFSTYPLVIHDESKKSLWAAKKYLIYLVGGSFLFQIPAMFLTYHYAGTLEYTAGGFLTLTDPGIALLILLFYIFGYTKAGIMPFHSWLPTAMVAPTPVSALLHAVAVVKAGVFLIVRVLLFVFTKETLLLDYHGLALATIVAGIASFTILLASLFAMTEKNLKLRLAYSTVSQLSYIVLGVALLTTISIKGGILHMAAHSFGKITLFFCAGAIFITHNIRNIEDMNGIGRKMPYTMFAYTLGTFAMIGAPPSLGLLSKWYMIIGAENFVFVAVLLVSALLNVGYFFPTIYRGYFMGTGKEKVKEASLFMLIPLMLTATLSAMFMIYPDVFIKSIDLILEGWNK